MAPRPVSGFTMFYLLKQFPSWDFLSQILQDNSFAFFFFLKFIMFETYDTISGIFSK